MTRRQLSDAFWTPSARLIVSTVFAFHRWHDHHHRTPVTGVHRPL